MARPVVVSAEVYQYFIERLSGHLPPGVPTAAEFFALYLDSLRVTVGERFDYLTESPGPANRRHFETPTGWGVVYLIGERQPAGHVVSCWSELPSPSLTLSRPVVAVDSVPEASDSAAV